MKTYGFKCVLVSPENHVRLSKMTEKGQPFNDTITKLLDFWETKQ